MATRANSTTAPAFQVLQVCRQCAADIRDTAITADPDALDEADRKSLLILADLIEIRAGYKVELRPALECALEGAIDILDAADAPSENLEDGNDAELGGDDEETLGWSAGMSQVKLGPNTADGDSTAPETHGKGFRRCSQDDCELVDEDGTDVDRGELDTSDLEPSIGWPEDYTAKLSDVLQADHDPEQDDADLEDSDDDHDHGAEPSWQRSAHPSVERGAHV